MSGLDARQLRDLCVRPALAALGLPGGLPMEKLVMGTACHESDGLRYIHQLGKGPALSLWQVEPATALDALDRAPLRCSAVMVELAGGTAYPGGIISQLPGNLYLGAAMCRLVYYLKPFPLSALEDGHPGALARAWKRFYNSPLGAGKESQFLTNWDRYCEEIYR